jgi:hypothetical protein
MIVAWVASLLMLISVFFRLHAVRVIVVVISRQKRESFWRDMKIKKETKKLPVIVVVLKRKAR